MKNIVLKAFLFLALTGLAAQVLAQQTPDRLPSLLFYEIVDGTSITITGCGNNDRTLNIPAQIQGLPVTSIGDVAYFSGSLTKITIPASVTYIGCGAFAGCHSLTSITIPPSVTYIGEDAFSGCRRLRRINIPASVTYIGEGAFSTSYNRFGHGPVRYGSLTGITVDSENSAYASIDGVLFDKAIRTLIAYPSGKKTTTYAIPSSVKSIEYGAFYRCRWLRSMTIPASVTTIEDHAFSDCNRLRSIIIPSSVTSIGEAAFSRCESLTSITIPSLVTTIGAQTFYGCYNLTTVIIPSSVTSIGVYAFHDCSKLTNITIPASVTSIGEYAFYRCDNLTNITISRRTRVGTAAFPRFAHISYWD